MRILFSVTPAYGHLLPIVPLAAAARRAGHPVAVLTAASIGRAVADELPEAEHLAAGATPEVFSGDAARRTGANVMQPTPEVIGEIFGASRLDLGFAESLEKASAWQPELIVAESFDAIGPLLAAALGVPWAQMGLASAVPDVIAHAIAHTAAPRYTDRGVEPTPPLAYLDPCPAALQTPGWAPPAPVKLVRPQAHRRPGTSWSAPPFLQPQRPTVLVTLGTIFSAPELLNAVVGAVASTDVNVIATRGMAIQLDDAFPQENGEPALIEAPNVTWVPFVPIDDLLRPAALVVGVGGAGTVIAALCHGLPMVLWPQGAEQPINAARAEATGASVTIGDISQLAPAVTAALHNHAQLAAARAVRDQINAMPTPDEVVAELTTVEFAGQQAYPRSTAH